MQTLMMPFARVRNFLDASDHSTMLNWTLENAGTFVPTLIDTGSLDATRRRSLSVRPPSEIKRLLRRAFEPKIDELLSSVGMSAFESLLEMEVAAHGDGAMFARHVDTGLHSLMGETRRLSAVYYYHREPKGFEGGCLRFHALLGNEFIDVEPEQNMLLVFPSYAPHEVLPVRCASGEFQDSRLAVNIWMHDKAIFNSKYPDALSSRRSGSS